MGTAAIILISIGLAMDCFAVSLSAGACVKNIRIRDTVKIAVFFGGFQAGMAFAGWMGGTGLSGMIEKFDHWVAFFLLVFVGVKMTAESFKKEEDKKPDYCRTKVVLLLAFATSIDALAVGISFSALKTGIFIPVIIIGAASFMFSAAGVYIGKKSGEFLGSKAEFAGGLILIGIGIKILLGM